ncbi:MAG: signal peptidase II [Bacteroidia bacterium]|nr:signal peptidase II [Bacteroidia bacterium]
MKGSDRNRIILLLAVVAANIGLDQISKIIIRNKVEFNEHIQLIGDYFIMTKVENTGAFLSLGSDFPDFIRIILLLVLPALVMIGGLAYILLKKNVGQTIGIPVAFLIGGGIGNLIDRILYGSVTDFLHIDLGGWARTGIFNVADMSIMFGMGLLLLKFVKDKNNKKEEETLPETESEAPETTPLTDSEEK